MALRLPAVCCAALARELNSIAARTRSAASLCRIRKNARRRVVSVGVVPLASRRSLLMVSTGQGRQPDTTIYLIVHPGHDTHAFLVRVAQLDTRNDTESHKA